MSGRPETRSGGTKKKGRAIACPPPIRRTLAGGLRRRVGAVRAVPEAGEIEQRAAVVRQMLAVTPDPAGDAERVRTAPSRRVDPQRALDRPDTDPDRTAS